MFIFLVDKQTNGVGSIRRVCSLVDLSSSTPIKDGQLYNTFNGSGKCIQTSFDFIMYYLTKLINILFILGSDNSKTNSKSFSKKIVASNMHRSSSVSVLDQVY